MQVLVLTDVEARALKDWLEITFTDEEQEILLESVPKIVEPLRRVKSKLSSET